MNLSYLLPQKEFTTSELTELATAFNRPVVKKYLSHLQAESIKSIANGLPDKGETAESYVRRQAVVVGGLGVLEALLQIENPTPSSTS